MECHATLAQHPDDAAVDRFAAAMKAKLAASRAKGRGGWDDPAQCSEDTLAKMLVEHVGKGNAGTFEDIANFAMMLHQRGVDPQVLANAAVVQRGWREALHVAVSAIYFDESADYKSALGAVVRHLDSELAGELLCAPKAAYDKSLALLAAATTASVTN